jgi:hypothetical protein
MGAGGAGMGAGVGAGMGAGMGAAIAISTGEDCGISLADMEGDDDSDIIESPPKLSPTIPAIPPEGGTEGTSADGMLGSEASRSLLLFAAAGAICIDPIPASGTAPIALKASIPPNASAGSDGDAGEGAGGVPTAAGINDG